MTISRFDTFANALLDHDDLNSSDYSAHRDALAKKLRTLRTRERFARWILIGLGMLALGSSLVIMALERTTRSTEWNGTIPLIYEVANCIAMVSWIAFPILLFFYLLRHLPNWWIANQSRQNWLLQELAESNRRIESLQSQLNRRREDSPMSSDSGNSP